MSYGYGYQCEIDMKTKKKKNLPLYCVAPFALPFLPFIRERSSLIYVQVLYNAMLPL